MGTSAYSEYIIKQLAEREATPEILRAREDPNYFIEYCFQDDSLPPAPIVQEAHHITLQDIMATKRREVILFPVGGGKTTQLTMRFVWELGNNSAIRIIVIGANGDQPQKIVQAVAREITDNPRVKEVFPRLRPAQGTIRQAIDTWRGTALRVEGAPSGQKDPSLSSFGLDGKVSGARGELIVGDNMLNFENTSSRLQRTKVTERFLKEVMTRIVPGDAGRAFILDTAWTRDDLPHTLMAKDSWGGTVFDAERNPGGPGVLWESRFPLKELERIKKEIGPLAYDLTYRNIPLSDSMGYFEEEAIDKAIGRVPWLTSYRGKGKICTGVDLATGEDKSKDLTVFTTVLYEAPIIKVLNVVAVRAVASNIIRCMIDIHNRFHQGGGPARFMVEDNAQQVYITQMAKDAVVLKALGAKAKQIAQFNVKGRTTTKRKRDLYLGIPALAADIEMGRIELPDHPEIISLKQEMVAWTPDLGHHTGDRLMSLWIAKAGVVAPRPRVTIV